MPWVVVTVVTTVASQGPLSPTPVHRRMEYLLSGEGNGIEEDRGSAPVERGRERREETSSSLYMLKMKHL